MGQVIPDRLTGVGRDLLEAPLVSAHRALLVGVGLDQAGIHRETLAADQPLGHAPAHDALKEVAQNIAVPEAAVAIAREGRVIGHLAVQAQPAEPPIGQVQVDLLAQPALRADGKAVAHDQHADHQLGIDRGPADGAVVAGQLTPHAGEIKEAIDMTQQVVSRNMIIEAKVVEQPIRRRLRPHHHPVLLAKP